MKDLKHIPIMHFDIQGFGQRGKEEQRSILVQQQKVVDSAAQFFMPYGKAWDKWQRHGTGGGFYFWSDALSPQVALRYAFNLRDELHERNRKHGQGLSIRIRIVLTIGDIELVGDQYVSEAFTEAKRISSYQPFKEYLNSSSQSAVIAITPIFRTKWSEDPLQNNPELSVGEIKLNSTAFSDKSGHERKTYVIGSDWPGEGRSSEGPVEKEIIVAAQAMTIKDIESQFDSEWVLLEDPQTNDILEVLGGKVLYHSKDRDEVYRKAVNFRLKRSAVVYTGEIPEDTAIVL